MGKAKVYILYSSPLISTSSHKNLQILVSWEYTWSGIFAKSEEHRLFILLVTLVARNSIPLFSKSCHLHLEVFKCQHLGNLPLSLPTQQGLDLNIYFTQLTM